MKTCFHRWLKRSGLFSLMVILISLTTQQPVFAAQSCDEAGLNLAIAAGGTQTFSCGSATTITITGTKFINKNVVLDGSNLLTISGGDAFQIFVIGDQKSLTLQNLTISHGNSSSSNGGAINGFYGSLTATHVTFSDNYSPHSGGALYRGTMTVSDSTFVNNSAAVSGGAIMADTLNVTNSTFTGNSSGFGGAIYATELNVSGSTFNSNSALTSGGAIYATGMQVNLLANTFSANTSVTGGALTTANGINVGITNIANSTFSNNSASTSGGAVYSTHFKLNIGNNTLVNNTAPSGGTVYFNGSNYFTQTAVFTLRDSIVQGSGCTVAAGTTSGSGNLTDDSTCPGQKWPVTGVSAVLAANGGATMTHALLADSNAIDAGLSCRYLSSDPPNTLITNPLFHNDWGLDVDQRGAMRDAPCDVGAFEYYQSTQLSTDSNKKIGAGGSYELGVQHPNVSLAQTFIITNHNGFALSLSGLSLPGGCTLTSSFPASIAANNVDVFSVQCIQSSAGEYSGILSFTTNDPNYPVYSFTLIYYIQMPGVIGAGTDESCNDAALSLALSEGGSISMNCGATPVTLLTKTPKTISNTVILDGGGLVTINGQNDHPLFVVNSGANLTLKNITLSGGSSYGYTLFGGALQNSGTTTIENSTLTDNRAIPNADTTGGLGGALGNINGGILNISNSTIRDNQAVAGGALYNYGATANILGSTFSGNSVSNAGGALFDDSGILNVANSTFSGNTGAGWGSAIGTGDGHNAVTVNISSSTFANNAAGGTSGTLAILNTLAGSSVRLQNSLFSGNTGGDCNKIDGTITGTKNLTADNHCPGKLGAVTQFNSTLAANGGATQTHVLLTGSNAIGAAGAVCTYLSSGSNPLFSDGSSILNDQRGRVRFNGCEIGAVEYTAPVITSQPADQTIISGSTAVLSVTADGGSGVPLVYQWYQGTAPDTSVPLGTNNPALTTPALTAPDHFWVRITNTYTPPDSTDSRSALISMNVAPTISVQPSDQTVSSGSSATLTVSAAGTSPLTYQWYIGSSGDTSHPIAGATQPSYTTRLLFSDRTFWVRVSNLESVDSTAAVISVISPDGAAPVYLYDTSGTPVITWNRVSDATGYEVQIATGSTFAPAAVVYDDDTLPSDTLFVSPTLENGLYYWRVRFKTDDGITWGSTWSEVQTIIVDVP